MPAPVSTVKQDGDQRTGNVSMHRWCLALVLLAFASVLAGVSVSAHKAITSKYTYNEDIFPIFQSKCGACHIDGGPAPMSLLAYGSDNGGVAAWAESIRETLVAEAMPPWYADPAGPAVRNSHSLSPRELDMVITWASGGAPQGDVRRKPSAVALNNDWPLGKPDVAIPLEAVTLGPDVRDADKAFTVATDFSDTRWVRAVDLLPGNAAIVRRAVISLDDGLVLAVWEPGSDSVPSPDGSAFKIPAGAALHVQLSYTKSWRDEQQARMDRSVIGLYFADPSSRPNAIGEFVVNGAGQSAPVPGTFSKTLASAARILAVRPSLDQPYATLDIQTLMPSGRRDTLMRLRAPRPEWPRRYWLADAVELPAGTQIEVHAVPSVSSLGPLRPVATRQLEIALAVTTP